MDVDGRTRGWEMQERERARVGVSVAAGILLDRKSQVNFHKKEILKKSNPEKRGSGRDMWI